MSDFYYVRTRGAGAFIRGNYTFTPEWQKVPAEDVRDFPELEILSEEDYRRQAGQATVAELREQAEALGLDLPGDAKKAQITRAIEKAEAAQAAAEETPAETPETPAIEESQP